jgi:hypothetical protein
MWVSDGDGSSTKKVKAYFDLMIENKIKNFMNEK